MKNKILKIGISGIIGSGKSEAIKFFKWKRFPSYDLDEISKKIMQPGESCYKKIIKTFGDKILDKNKKINREEFRKIIFNDDNKRLKLNSIVHPELLKKVKEFSKIMNSKKKRLIFFEGALINKKTKIGDFLDYIILIKCTKKNIIKRVKDRDHVHFNEINTIFNIQNEIHKKKDMYDFVVTNNEKIDAFRTKLNSILEKISH